MKIKTFFILGVILSFILAALFGGFIFYKISQKPDLPVLGEVKNFKLINVNNQNFTLDDLKGKVWVADFFFTTCADICPIMTKNMSSLHRTFQMLDDITLVSISVNPEFDSPEILQKYAEKYNVKNNKWQFLTGDRQEIKNLALNSFKLGSIKEPVFHSDKFTLVDRAGLIRGYYDGTKTEELNRLFKDASRLLKKGK